jgi:glycosyltransferase involved in cell wall biosynthesis
MPPLRITIVQGAFLPVPPLLGGAVEKVWHALGEEFARQGHRVVHVSRAYEQLPRTNVEAGVTHVRVRGSATPKALWQLKLRDLTYSLRARRVLPEADILVTNTFWLPLLERRPSRGRPYVHVARYPKGQLRLYPRRTILQTVSAPIRAAILQEVPDAGNRVRVLPYPLAPAYLTGRRADPERVILYTGRLHPEKGVHLLVDAFRRLAPGPLANWRLRIIGPWTTAQGGGGEPYRAQLLAAAGGDARIEIVEPIFDAARLAAEYQRAAVFAYPSLAERGETFGLAVLEAMAGGCAPVVSALGCFGDFLQHDRNGLVFDHRAADPAGPLAAALARLAAPAGPREELRAAAWTTARAYTLPEIALRFAEDFATVAERLDRTRSYGEPCLSDPT